MTIKVKLVEAQNHTKLESNNQVLEQAGLETFGHFKLHLAVDEDNNGPYTSLIDYNSL